MLICGIDEARRGPIIGPMVMCAAFIKEKDMPKLLKLDPKDSKLMTPQEREEKYEYLTKLLKYKLSIMPPEEIDRAVNDTKLNLNWLEAVKQAEILNEMKPDKAIIDCPSNNIEAYGRYLKKLLKVDTELILEHNAERYPIVAAASIIAKVTGDGEIAKLKKKLKIDFGSGYLSDPKTALFLEKHWESHKDIFRKSWLPYQDLVKQKMQRKLGDYSAPAEKKGKLTKEDLEILEDYGFVFKEPKSSHEEAIMKGPCTVILYKKGTLLTQGDEKACAHVKRLLGVDQ